MTTVVDVGATITSALAVLAAAITVLRWLPRIAREVTTWTGMPQRMDELAGAVSDLSKAVVMITAHLGADGRHAMPPASRRDYRG